MERRIIFVSILVFLSIGSVNTQQIQGKKYMPPEGFVPDEETAIKIAEAVWLPIYGRSVLGQKPYKATLIDGKNWLVVGTEGKVAFAEIDKYSGEILRVNLLANSIGTQYSPGGHMPSKGFVPDEETAIKIAEAVWLPIYGRSVLGQKPYKATLMDGKNWLVEGTGRRILSFIFASGGGVAFTEIDKFSGEILWVIHER
jgi:hypothetical protein